ncbi:hypothetical protein IPP92_04530 [Candidatus Saccharibacteria bacterium]|jgi:hypothetical protein|nr:hypothetical protein [Candidatus Saccharimonas sp.]QQS68244.1 MAG: hypothetical protein IPP24_04525 [Candidatus Saccharibacteria bacterium]QQS70568.1 MAG: hypothetical protein IPP92_04530 [Candidatus Saccharibacteria bacterium]
MKTVIKETDSPVTASHVCAEHCHTEVTSNSNKTMYIAVAMTALFFFIGILLGYLIGHQGQSQYGNGRGGMMESRSQINGDSNFGGRYRGMMRSSTTDQPTTQPGGN